MDKKKFYYLKNCTQFTFNDIKYLQEMIDNSMEIKWETFMKYISKKDLQQLFPYYKWHGGTGKNLHIKNDYAVTYYKSKYKNKLCYYLSHSSIEYIFI